MIVSRAYPEVLSEEATLDRLVAGDSIARFGDGELKIACGAETATHRQNNALMNELRGILKNPNPACLVGIPNPVAVANRWKSWHVQRCRWGRLMDVDRVYGSAFVGRTKVAPWIDTDAYREKFRSVWRGKRTLAIAPPTHLLPRWLVEDGADVVGLVNCPALEAYARIDYLETQAKLSGASVIVICGGPMATALANRLAGYAQAIDLGRGSGFLWK